MKNGRKTEMEFQNLFAFDIGGDKLSGLDIKINEKKELE